MTSWTDRLGHKLPSAERLLFLTATADKELTGMMMDLLKENIHLTSRYCGLDPSIAQQLNKRQALLEALCKAYPTIGVRR